MRGARGKLSRIMPKDAYQPVAWLGLEFRVPNDWQIVRHGIAVQRGSLTFVDRRRERLTLSWRDCQREPDLVRMVADQRKRDQSDAGGVRFDALAVGPRWHGYVCNEPSRDPLARAVHYDATNHRLVELVSTTGLDEPVRRILSELRLQAPCEGRRRLIAFSLDLTLPEHFKLSSTKVLPADARLDFEFDRGKARRFGATQASIRRMGMARAWYAGDARWLIRRESPKVSFASFSETRHDAHPAVVADGVEPDPRFLRLVGRGRRRRALVWQCEAENAVYHVMTVSPFARPVAPEAFAVRCCREAGHG